MNKFEEFFNLGDGAVSHEEKTINTKSNGDSSALKEPDIDKVVNFTFSVDFTELHARFDEILTALINMDKKLNILYNKSKQQIEKISEFENEIMDLQDKINKLCETDGQLSADIQDIIDLVKSNIKPIIRSEFLRSEYNKGREIRSGENAPRFRKDVKTDDIIRDYLNKVPVKEIAKKYNMGANGIRTRLKKAGVWQGRIDNK